MISILHFYTYVTELYNFSQSKQILARSAVSGVRSYESKKKSNTINDSHSLDYFYVFVEHCVRGGPLEITGGGGGGGVKIFQWMNFVLVQFVCMYFFFRRGSSARFFFRQNFF